MLPHAIGVGPARAATTWLWQCLKDHPDVCWSVDKKTDFFDLYYDRGLAWYEEHFAHCPPGKVVCELTETYLFYDEVPARIRACVPEAKIFTCLRNPVDRALSAYLHLKREGIGDLSFEQAMDRFGKALVDDSLYYDHLKPYFELFPRERIHVCFFVRIPENPLGFIQTLYAFLGVDPTHVPAMLDQKLNPTRPPRFWLLNRMMRQGNWLLRDLGLLGLRARLKESTMVQKLYFGAYAQGPPALDIEKRARLWDIFRQQVQGLETLLGQDLSFWR